MRISFWGLERRPGAHGHPQSLPRRRSPAWDVLQNGYWHARGPEFLNADLTILIEWLRLPADLIFILLGVVPMLIAVGRAWGYVRK